MYETKGPFTDIPVFFEDMLTDSIHELHTGQVYRFHAEAGTHMGRFRLHLHQVADPTYAGGPLAASPVRLWTHNATLYLDSQKEVLEVLVYDVSGRLLHRFISGWGSNHFPWGCLRVCMWCARAWSSPGRSLSIRRAHGPAHPKVQRPDSGQRSASGVWSGSSSGRPTRPRPP